MSDSLRARSTQTETHKHARIHSFLRTKCVCVGTSDSRYIIGAVVQFTEHSGSICMMHTYHTLGPACGLCERVIMFLSYIYTINILQDVDGCRFLRLLLTFVDITGGGTLFCRISTPLLT